MSTTLPEAAQRITVQAMQSFHDALQQAMKKVASEHGLTVRLERPTLDRSRQFLSFRVEASLGDLPARKEYERLRLLGFPQPYLPALGSTIYDGAEPVVVVGASPMQHIIVRDTADNEYTLTLDTVRQIYRQSSQYRLDQAQQRQG